jgi:hypothetical protein
MQSLLFLAAIIGGAIWFSFRFTKYLQWKEHHYLYRVKCSVHGTILMETGEYPNIYAFFCTLCSSQDDNIILEQFDITRFSFWERVE